MKKTLRLLAAFALAAASLFAFTTSPASAQAADDYPDAACTINVTVTGTTISIDIQCVGFPPNVTVTISIDGVVVGQQTTTGGTGTGENAALPASLGRSFVLGQAVSDSTGAVSGTYQIPADCREHTVTVEGGGVSRSSTFVAPGCPAAGVTPRTGGAGGALPYTGSDSAPFLQIGVLLVAGGAAAVFFYRQRAKHNEA